MKKRSLILLVALCLAGVSAASAEPAAPPPAFSLQQIVTAALAHNPGLAASRADVETADRQVDVARTLGVPVLSLDANAQYLPTRGAIVALEQTPQLVQHPGYEGGVAGMALTVPLYTGGRIPLQTRIAELGTLVAQHRLDQTTQDLIFNLSSLYYTALRLDATVAATQQSITSLKSAQHVVSEFVSVGKAPELDLLRVQARLANVEQDLVSVQNADAVTLAGMSTLMGSPADTPMRLSGTLAYQPADTAPALEDVPALVRGALQDRPDYLATQAQLAEQRQRVRLARAQLHPEVSLDALYGVQTGEFLPSQGAGHVLLDAKMPLFDATLTAKIRHEEAAEVALQHRLDNIRLQVGLDVEKAVLAIADANARTKASEAGLAQARESLRDEELKLRLGKGIITDVLQAQAEELQAEELHDDALADERIAQAQFKHALGTLEAPQETAETHVGAQSNAI